MDKFRILAGFSRAQKEQSSEFTEFSNKDMKNTWLTLSKLKGAYAPGFSDLPMALQCSESKQARGGVATANFPTEK